MDKSKVARFFGPPCIAITVLNELYTISAIINRQIALSKQKFYNAYCPKSSCNDFYKLDTKMYFKISKTSNINR